MTHNTTARIHRLDTSSLTNGIRSAGIPDGACVYSIFGRHQTSDVRANFSLIIISTYDNNRMKNPSHIGYEFVHSVGDIISPPGDISRAYDRGERVSKEK